jgi:hypothetical protein
MKKPVQDPMYDVKAMRQWMMLNHHDYPHSTALAESCAEEFDVYEERLHYTIPEVVYEIALEFYPED